MKFQYLIYVVSDNEGHKVAATADEPSDNIHLCGLTDRDGNRFTFESEAYHLKDWCEIYGLELNILSMDAHV